MQRRTFLRGLMGAAALVIVPAKLAVSAIKRRYEMRTYAMRIAVSAEAFPRTIYGDGVHDDADAIQAWFNGETVVRPDGTVVGDRLEHETFLFGKSITVPHPCKRKSFSYNHITVTDEHAQRLSSVAPLVREVAA